MLLPALQPRGGVEPAYKLRAPCLMIGLLVKEGGRLYPHQTQHAPKFPQEAFIIFLAFLYHKVFDMITTSLKTWQAVYKKKKGITKRTC